MAPNPLERFFDLGDVEMVEPVSTNAKEESRSGKTEKSEGGEIENPFLRQQIAERTVEDAEKARYFYAFYFMKLDIFRRFFLSFKLILT